MAKRVGEHVDLCFSQGLSHIVLPGSLWGTVLGADLPVLSILLPVFAGAHLLITFILLTNLTDLTALHVKSWLQAHVPFTGLGFLCSWIWQRKPGCKEDFYLSRNFPLKQREL